MEREGKERKREERKSIYIYTDVFPWAGDGCFARKGQVERFSSERQRTMDQRVP